MWILNLSEFSYEIFFFLSTLTFLTYFGILYIKRSRGDFRCDKNFQSAQKKNLNVKMKHTTKSSNTVLFQRTISLGRGRTSRLSTFHSPSENKSSILQ